MTTTAVHTLKDALTKADPNQIADALRKVDLGNLLTVKEYDTGTVSALTGGVVLPEKALMIQSVRVVTATTGTIVGTYVAADASATKVTAGTGSAVGICRVDATGQTLTFTAADVTRAIVRYIPAPAALLTDKFATV